MKITPIGASGGEVTGSAYVVQTRAARILVDCGLFQGSKRAEAKNRMPVREARLDAVVITHGHLDHTGRLPVLAKLGYRGPVFATQATQEMTSLVLRDSAKIQKQDTAWANKKRVRAGEPPLEPLYGAKDVQTVLGLFRTAPYEEPVPVAPGIKASFAEAGHMLGSASIQLLVEEEGREKKVVFSGDLGPISASLLRRSQPFRAADMVFMESTYGNRDHRPFRQTVEEFVAIIKTAAGTQGTILIPTFAIGRAQLLVTLLSMMFRKKMVKPFPIFLDSPMAIEATKIYSRHPELFDEQMRKYIQERPLREDLKTLTPCVTPKQSQAVNESPRPCLVMAGSGMCNAGRILHHLQENLWKPETFVLMVGYQAQGTVGRQLVDGAPYVRIFGARIAVKATIRTLGGFSAHAGQTDLLSWVAAVAPSRPVMVLTHGEDPQRQALAQRIHKEYHLKTLIPQQGDVIDL